MKKTIPFFIFLFASLLIALPVRADTQRLIRKKTASPSSALRKVTILKEKAVITDAGLISTSGATLTVSKDGKTVIVSTDAKTRFKRKFFGNSAVSEFQAGDFLDIRGFWSDETKTAISAVFVRDTSIQKRFGAFVGTVKSISASGFTISTVARGDQTVTVNPKTKYFNRMGRTIDSSEFSAGQRVRVKGVWNNRNNTITEVTQVKNYDLPARKISPTTTPKDIF